MVVSVEKCSVTLFSKDVKDSKMEGVNVELDGKQLKVERYPTFLGVKYDGKLVFGEQCDKVVGKARGRVKLLRALADKDWIVLIKIFGLEHCQPPGLQPNCI